MIELTVIPPVQAGLSEALSALSSLTGINKYYSKANKKLQAAELSLQHGKVEKALKLMLSAAEKLAKINDNQAADIRRMIDHAIAQTVLLLP